MPVPSFLASEPYGHQEGVRAFNASCICFALTSFAAAAFALALGLTTVATSALIFAVASRTSDWWLHQCLDIKTSHPVDEQYCHSLLLCSVSAFSSCFWSAICASSSYAHMSKQHTMRKVTRAKKYICCSKDTCGQLIFRPRFLYLRTRIQLVRMVRHWGLEVS